MSAVFPEENAGLDCVLDADGGVDPSCGVPTNASIEIRFDRYLFPGSATRQAILLYQRREADDVLLGSPFSEPTYDVVERVVVYRPNGLAPSSLYTLEFVVPRDTNRDGFRAFDGAPLESGRIPLLLQFRTAAGPIEMPEPAPPAGCEEAMRFFRAGGCGAAGCHNPNSDKECPPGEAPAPGSNACLGVPRMGLKLDTPEGLLETAVNRVAHQTEIGPRGGLPRSSPRRMGVEMPLIEPGKPGNSYLMYKLLRKDSNFRGLLPDDACVTDHTVPLPGGECLPPSPEESARLREWFVRGDPMPLNNADQLSLNLLKRLQSWIAADAVCP